MSRVRGRLERLERAEADLNHRSQRNPFDTLATYLVPGWGPPVPGDELTDYELRLLAAVAADVAPDLPLPDSTQGDRE
jgi:hypothetical protein